MKPNNKHGIKSDVEIKKAKHSNPERDLNPLDLEIAAIVPLRLTVADTIDMNETLIRKCADAIRESAYIDRIVITADHPKLFKMADRFGDAIKLLRPETLSHKSVRVHDVLKFTLDELNQQEYHPDLLMPVEITYPFRPHGIFDNIIEMLISNEYDTVIAGVAEYRICWKKEKNGFKNITDLSLPRSERIPLHVGLPSLASAIYPGIVRQGRRYGDRIGIYEIDDPFAAIEIRTPEQLKSIAQKFYWPES